MRKIKLFVIFLFCAAALLTFGRSIPFFKVSSQTGGLTAPTGVAASDGNYINKVAVSWDAVRNATNYRILRATTADAAAAVEIGASAAGTFLDTTATPGQTFFYWVRAENAAETSQLSQADQGLRSVGQTNGGTAALNPPTAPAGNPVTAAKAALGKALFWDEQLSSTYTVSCGTCHMANNGGSDPRTVVGNLRARNAGADSVLNTADDVFASPGVPSNNADGTYNWSSIYGFREQVTSRKSNSFINAAYAPLLFWDGRASGTFTDPISGSVLLANGAALESQAAGPPVNGGEMAHANQNWSAVAAQISNAKPLALSPSIPSALNTWSGGRNYAEIFQEVYGTPEVTPARIIMAIASYERTLYSDQTPFDAAVSNITPLTAAENRGQTVFNQANCNACHAGTLFTDNQFHYIGVRPQTEDTGRFQVTGNANNTGQFRTPGLRNVGLRAPYMHTGQFATLEEVVDFYNRGGDFTGPNKDPRVRPLGLSAQQRADLAAFLRRPLTDPRLATGTAPFDRPQLYSESARVPQIVGTGVPGASGQVPQVTAIEPPLAGNPSFTVGVSNALGGVNAVLVINATDPGTAGGIPPNGSMARVSVQLAGSGSGNGFGSASIAIPNNAAIINQTFFGRWYISDSSAPGGVAISPAFRFTVFGEATQAVRKAAPADFDGDGKTDVSIFRPSSGEWWYSKSSDSQVSALQFGLGTDKIVPADFSGDGKTDVAVWRESTGEWFILRSDDNSFYSIPFGAAGDIPAAGDFDADGKADLTIFRPSTGTWFIQTLTQGTIIQNFGQAGDIPVVGDYDGDGKSDTAVYRPSTGEWWLNRSTSGVVAAQFGTSTDKPVAQDWTGDGKTDLAFWRPSTGEWFILRSENASFYSVPFGQSGDIAAPGDYDGDGRADTAVFRPSTATWYVNRSSQGLMIAGFGVNGDQPAPAAFIP
ncbi:MAG TPA: cytochrome c peroxidase [Pyrinomonadaceae bacterium]|jgi:cytochrome c peroxidase